ncbi:MAG: DUF4190 domain-containing protein [Acidobacteriia bacterium]|nr:DUF4190 domain-containing protein [Terriglobia bacterium]
MFCQRCGAENPNEGRFCIQCGAALQGLASPSAAGQVPGGAAPSSTGAAVTSGKAIGSLICGLLGFIPFVSIAAIVLGHLSLSEIRKSAGRLTGQGLAIAGLVLGYLGLFYIVLIVAAIAIPNLLRSRMAANEAAAIGSLRTINIAAIGYSSTYSNGFPPSLDALGGTGAPTCDHAALIDSVLASGEKSGYVFTYTPQDMLPSVPPEAKDCTTPGANAFTLNADPVTRGTTGGRGFFVDETGVIRQQVNGTATADSPPIR